MAKGKRPRTKELYNSILGAYRAVGNNHIKAALHAGVDRSTARRCFEAGWPEFDWGIPIREQLLKDQLIVRAARAGADPDEQIAVAERVLVKSLEKAKEDAKDAAGMLATAAKAAQTEQAKANAALEEAKQKLIEVENLARARMDDAEKAAQATLARAEIEAKQRLANLLAQGKVDAAETIADEANAAKFGRKAALSAVVIAALVMKDASVIAGKLRQQIEDMSNLKPMEAMRVAREMIRLVEAAEKSLILALQAERLRVGQPTEMIGIQTFTTSVEEKEIKLRAVARALERAKQRGLSLVNGGNSGDQAPVPGSTSTGQT